MEHKTFINTLSRSCSMDTKRTGVLAEALKDIIVRSLINMDDVAIPGFGTFSAVKTNEYVAIDPVTGQRMLMPPSVKASLRVGSGLKKAVLKTIKD